MCEAVDRLIALSATFAGEVHAAQGEQLAAHLNKFREAVGRLDEARTAIRQTLSRLGEDEVYVPDESAPHSPVHRRFVNDGDGLRVEFGGAAPNAVPGIVTGLRDVWDVVWDVPAAYRDVDRLLAGRPTPELARAIEAWRDSLRVYTAADERYRLFGTYLLDKCHQALEPQSPTIDENNFPRRLARHFTRFMQLIVMAAEYQAGPVADQHARTLIGSGVEQSGGCGPGKRQWFHSLQERRPERFGRGPLSGPPKVLAGIICPVFGVGTDRRALYKLGDQGQIWIVRRHSKLLEVYFQDGSQFDTCEAAFREAVNRQQLSRRHRN